MKALLALACIVAALMAPVQVFAQTASSTETQVVAAARLFALAERAVHAAINAPDREVRAEYKFTDQVVPAGKVTIDVQAAQYNPTYIAIPLLLSVDGKPIRTLYCGYRIITYVHTAVAAHDLSAGSVLDAGNLIIGRVPTNGRPPLEVASLTGRKLSVAVAAGAPVYFEQTRVNELVMAGQPVIYILHDGPVVVSADVIARTGGGMGQVVAVYNPVTRKALSGVVTGPGKVEFTLPGDETE